MKQLRFSEKKLKLVLSYFIVFCDFFYRGTNYKINLLLELINTFLELINN